MKYSIYFYKPNCGPCNEAKSAINKYAESNKVDFVNLNEVNTISEKLNVLYAPTLVIIDEEIKSITKYEGSKKINKFLDENII